jgi:ADP-ribose pyrophosphatase YjhB (NUDIX family)
MKEAYQYCPSCGSVLELGVIEGKERKFCPNCDFIDYKNPLPVAIAIAVKDKKFLLIKRGVAPRKGTWSFPSGFIEVGETPEEACLRELKEETGVSGEIARLIGVGRVENKEIYGDMLVVRYLVIVGDEEPVPGEEVEGVKYFEVGELPEHYVARLGEVIEEIQNAK